MPQIGSSSYSESPVPSESYVSGETTITLQDHEAAADAHAGIIATHDADTSTHGVTTVAGLEETQTLSNKTLASPVITGTLSGSAITLTGNLTVGGTLGATSGTFSGTLGVTGNFAVNTNKFVVTAASGNTTVAGTLGVTGASTLAALSATTGTFSSTLAATGNFTVNTNKFVVTAASGNTTVAGTLGVTGASTLAALSATTGTFSSTLAATGNLTVNTDKFFVNASTGNVGIGTTSPVGELDIYTAAATPYATRLWVRQGAHYLSLLATDTGDGSAIVWNNSEPLRFATIGNTNYASWTERMRIDTSGNVGLGTTSPEGVLHLHKSGADWVNLKIERSAANLAAAVNFLAQTAASGTPDWFFGKDHRDTSDSDLRIWRYTGSHQTADFTINSSGNVGINDTTPSYKLDVAGTFRATGNAFANSDLTVGGSLYVNGGSGANLAVVGSITATDSAALIGGAMGTNARGTRLALNYNSDSGGGPGTVRFQSADGNYNYVYSDNSDVLRIYATSNPSYEMIASTLASGTVVGTQTSHSSYKYVLGEPDDILATYRRIRSAANDVFDFTYKDGRFGRGVFQGIVIDRVPHYAMDPKPGFEDGDVLNEINLFGDIVRALADVDLRLNRIETGVPSEL